MQIVWDEPKRLTNLEKHELDFAALTKEWFEQATTRPARGNRSKAIGWFDGQLIAVIFARLGTEGISVISMRPASPIEQREFDE